MRTFVAVPVPDASASVLASWRKTLSGTAGDLRWVREDGVHVTLKFLGDVEFDRVPAIVGRLRAAATAASPFPLELGAIGVFPDPRRATILWCGINDPSGGLTRLRQAVESGLSLEGFVTEGRAFHPHVTLGRWREPPTRARAAALVGQPRLPQARWTVQDMQLMESRLTPGGSIYTLLESLPLGEGDASGRQA